MARMRVSVTFPNVHLRHDGSWLCYHHSPFRISLSSMTSTSPLFSEAWLLDRPLLSPSNDEALQVTLQRTVPEMAVAGLLNAPENYKDCMYDLFSISFPVSLSLSLSLERTNISVIQPISSYHSSPPKTDLHQKSTALIILLWAVQHETFRGIWHLGCTQQGSFGGSPTTKCHYSSKQCVCRRH